MKNYKTGIQQLIDAKKAQKDVKEQKEAVVEAKAMKSVMGGKCKK